MIEEDIAFVVISALTVGAAIFALESKQVVYGAIALGFSLLGVAGLFIVLDATYVALFQIIVYIGAVAVLILFTVMLVGESKLLKESPTTLGMIGWNSYCSSTCAHACPQLWCFNDFEGERTSIGSQLSGNRANTDQPICTRP